jgi:hypothetical protein
MHRKLFKSLLLIIVSLCCFNAAYALPHSVKNHPAALTTLNLPTFSALDINGNVKVILLGKQSKQQVTLFAAPKLITEQIYTSVQNNILTINAPIPLSQAPLVVKISMVQPLTHLTVRGSASVVAEHCANPNLILTVQDAGKVNLKGLTTVGAIQNDSNRYGNITISGLNSKHLVVRGNGQGKMLLSGHTIQLDVQLTGSALFDACQLLADQGRILTYNNAIALVNVTDALYGFAYDNSNIYYYERPKKVVSDTHASGNVLKLVPNYHS